MPLSIAEKHLDIFLFFAFQSPLWEPFHHQTAIDILVHSRGVDFEGVLSFRSETGLLLKRAFMVELPWCASRERSLD